MNCVCRTLKIWRYATREVMPATTCLCFFFKKTPLYSIYCILHMTRDIFLQKIVNIFNLHILKKKFFICCALLSTRERLRGTYICYPCVHKGERDDNVHTFFGNIFFHMLRTTYDNTYGKGPTHIIHVDLHMSPSCTQYAHLFWGTFFSLHMLRAI